MKKLLLATTIALSFAPACFAQEKSGDERKLFVRRTSELSMIQLEEDSVRITTAMQKKQYGGGEDAILQITIKNMGTKPFGNPYISLNDEVYEFYDIDVVDQTGRKIPQLKIPPRSITGGQTGWGLAPGQTQKASVWLNNLFDFSYGGLYKVTVSKTFRKDGKLITISSEPIEFERTSGKPIATWGAREDGD